MRIKNGVIGVVLLLQLSCSNDGLDINSFRDDSSITTLNGTWKVVSFENYIENSIELKNQANSKGLDIVVTFNDMRDPNELSGKNTTNTVFGKFDYIGTRKFKIFDYGTTEIAQPVWADKFNEAILDGEVDFKISVRTLRVYYNNNAQSVTLARQ
jgi:hypothetical protein